jgi:hypothetical protein
MYPYSSVVSNTQDKCIVLQCSQKHTRQIYQSSSVFSTFVLYVTDYTGVRIHLSCVLLTTLEYGFICLVCYWLHWSTDTFVLHVTDYTGVRLYLSCMLLTTPENGCICLVCYWIHWRTDIFVLYVSDYTGVRYICLVCYWLHWSTDTFVLYVTYYTGVGVWLSCMLLTTLEYGYICLVCYWQHTRQIYPYSTVVSNIQDKYIRTPV